MTLSGDGCRLGGLGPIEDELAVARVHQHRITLPETPLEQRLGQRVQLGGLISTISSMRFRNSGWETSRSASADLRFEVMMIT